MFLAGVEIEDHLTDDPPTSQTARYKWLDEDNQLFGTIYKTLYISTRHMISHCN